MIRATTIVTCDVEGCGYSAQFGDLGGITALMMALQARGWTWSVTDDVSMSRIDAAGPRLTCPMHKKAIRGDA